MYHMLCPRYIKTEKYDINMDLESRYWAVDHLQL